MRNQERGGGGEREIREESKLEARNGGIRKREEEMKKERGSLLLIKHERDGGKRGGEREGKGR